MRGRSEERPPRLARAVVRALSDAEDRAFLLADLDERFHVLVRARGRRAARRWYWRQALSAVPWALLPDGGLRERRGWSGFAGDVRLGLRTLRRSPLYAVGVAGTLALGIAAATVVTAVAWRIWLAPMPYPEPDQVVRLWEVEPAEASGAPGDVAARRHRLSAGLLEDLRRRSWTTIEGVSAVLPPMDTPWRRDGERRLIQLVMLSPNGFGMLGITPLEGRLPTETEREVLLDERFWRAEFGGDPDVVGTLMDIGPLSTRIVGVARIPNGFPGPADIVGTIEWAADEEHQIRFVGAIARLRPGHSPAEAEAELDAHLAALAATYPEHHGWTMNAPVLADDLVRPFRGVLALLLAAGVAFLLLAAVNVLGLVAARRVAGRRDRAVRLALGASEGRLLRGSLIESLVLSGLGGAAGVVGAVWLIDPLRALVPQEVPRLDAVAVDAPLSMGALAVAFLLGGVVGGAGYLASRGAPPAVGRAPVWRRAGSGGRRVLVVTQVALTALFVAGGAAILHRVATLDAIELGFEPEAVWTTVPGFHRESFPWTEVLDGLEARGVRAAVSFNAPLKWEDESVGLVPFPVEGRPKPILYQVHVVSPGYLYVMGIHVVAGRPLRRSDDETGEKVVVVNEAFAEELLPPGTPLARIVGRMLHPVILMREPSRVVGVVRPTRHHGPDEPLVPEIYIAFAQQITVAPSTLLMRGGDERAPSAVADVLARIDPDMRWSPLQPYTIHLDEWFAPLRLQIVTITVLGGLGLLLATLGLYAVLAYQVASRHQELGIRKAVGATDGHLLRRVLAGGMGLAAVGAGVGLSAWYALRGTAATLVEGIDAAGGAVPVSVVLVVGVSCLLATLVPALRVTRVDPVVTLKTE